MLPTGMSPEGLTTVTKRQDGQQLFVTANEKENSLNIYRFHALGVPAGATEPQLVAKKVRCVPFVDLSNVRQPTNQFQLN